MFNLSPSQEIVWLHEQVVPGSRSYNFTAFLDVRGPFYVAAFQAALAAVIAHHSGLRLELVDASGALARQRIREEVEPRFRVSDLSLEPDQDLAFQELLAGEAKEPIDVTEAPLLRWHLVKLDERHHRLIHVEHHLTHDGRSFTILLRDLFTAYRAHLDGGRPELAATRSYEEYVQLVGTASADARARSLKYWKQELRGAPLNVSLVGLGDFGAVRRHHGRQLRLRIEPDVAERLRENCRASGHTPFSTLLTLFGELLHRHSGQNELIIGTAVGNRPVGFEETIGMFVNTLPLRLHLRASAPGAEAVDDVTDTLLRALPHQDVPVQELTRALGAHATGSENPLFNVMFSAHDSALPDDETAGLKVALHEAINSGTTRFDLDVVLLPDDRRVVGARSGAAGMILIWDYDADVFGADAVDLLARRFLDLLRAYLADPYCPLGALAVQSAGALPDAGVSVDFELLNPLGAHDPASLALVSSREQLTYGDLDRRATALAERLRAAGVTVGQPVAVVVPRGVDSIVALLACLRLGAVYAPLSPDDPAPRLELLLERLKPSLVLATRSSSLSLPIERAVALLDGANFPAAAPAPVLDGGAYVIHTSGSTGVPKPALVSRTALAAYVRAITERYGLRAQDGVLLFAHPSFDVALEEVLPSLAAGCRLVLPQTEIPTGPELAAVLALRGVTVANLPTSYFLAVQSSLREAASDGRWSPRLIVLGGERLPAPALRGILDDTGAAVYNAYGVTEAVVTSVVHEVTEADTGTHGDIPLGQELPGARVHVLDDGLWPLPDGGVGELAIGGPMLADGYPGNEVITSARFVTLGSAGGQRVYLTGDRGYRDLSGELHFLGRLDNQIKLRGRRIEPEEIEVAVSATLGGRSCAVVLSGGAEAGPRLVGFLGGAEPLDQASLTAALALRLPGSHVPMDWVILESIPTLAGGKPDRAALARIASERDRAEAQRSQSDAGLADLEWNIVAQGWRVVLGHERFTASSHFFEVGGHSLLTAQLAAWLEPHLGSRPPLRVFFQHPVLADQVCILTGAGAQTGETTGLPRDRENRPGEQQ
jgi:amino acid adenylation domain-containing protein